MEKSKRVKTINVMSWIDEDGNDVSVVRNGETFYLKKNNAVLFRFTHHRAKMVADWMRKEAKDINDTKLHFVQKPDATEVTEAPQTVGLRRRQLKK